MYAFARNLGKPIVLDGKEHIEYVPTQVITEYLRYIPHFDVGGIMFRSAQNSGVNCLIFTDSDGCIDDSGKEGEDRKPFAKEKETLRLRTESVKWVRMVTMIADDSFPYYPGQ
jgi:hypothetical protein